MSNRVRARGRAVGARAAAQPSGRLPAMRARGRVRRRENARWLDRASAAVEARLGQLGRAICGRWCAASSALARSAEAGAEAKPPPRR